MDAEDWEQRFEEAVSAERVLMIELLDAARAMTGAFRPAGTSEANAASAFAQKYAGWREAAEAVKRLAENSIAQH